MSDTTSDRRPSRPADLADLIGRGSLPVELRRASGMKKLDYITNLPAPASFVGALAPEELYLLIADIGKNDAYILLNYASDEQLRALVDLDAWQGHELQLSRWLEWLDLVEAADLDTALRFIQANDDELLEWLFVRDVQVLGNDVELSDIPDELAAFQTPDGLYTVTVPREHELAQRLPRLMKLMWAADIDRSRLILQQARFDLPSSVEEYMGWFRAGRLQDLGFEAPSEAAAVFSPRNPHALRERARGQLASNTLAAIPAAGFGAVVEDLALRHITPPSLLAAALGRLDDEARAHFAEAMTALINRVFMALTGDLSRTDDLPTAGQHAAALVNLGLQFVADDDVTTASQILERIWPVELFQAGHALSLEVGLAARRVRRRAGADRGLALFGAPSDEALHGVALPRPLLFEGVLDARRLGYRPFRELAELAAVDALVREADALLRFFEERLGFSPEALTGLPLAADVHDRVRLATLLRTGIAQVALSDSFGFTPLSRADIEAFARLAFDADGQLSERLRQIIARIVAEAPAAVGALAERATAELREAIGEVAPEDIELRFVGDLFLTTS